MAKLYFFFAGKGIFTLAQTAKKILVELARSRGQIWPQFGPERCSWALAWWPCGLKIVCPRSVMTSVLFPVKDTAAAAAAVAAVAAAVAAAAASRRRRKKSHQTKNSSDFSPFSVGKSLVFKKKRRNALLFFPSRSSLQFQKRSVCFRHLRFFPGIFLPSSGILL